MSEKMDVNNITLRDIFFLCGLLLPHGLLGIPYLYFHPDMVPWYVFFIGVFSCGYQIYRKKIVTFGKHHGPIVYLGKQVFRGLWVHILIYIVLLLYALTFNNFSVFYEFRLTFQILVSFVLAGIASVIQMEVAYKIADRAPAVTIYESSGKRTRIDSPQTKEQIFKNWKRILYFLIFTILLVIFVFYSSLSWEI
jgi:hypothetical protein